MKTEFILAVSLSVAVILGASLDVGAGELPFGIQLGHYWTTNNLPDSIRDVMRDSLGFNFCFLNSDTTGISQSRLDFFRQHGLPVIPWMNDLANAALTSAFNAYMNAHHFVVQAENDTSEARFLKRCADSSLCWADSGWVGAYAQGDSFILLDSLWFDHERSSLRGVVEYKPFLGMRVDTVPVPSGVTLGSVRVWAASIDSNGWISNLHGTLIREYPIMSDSFSGGNNNPRGLEFVPPFTVPENMTWNAITYQITSTGQLPFAIDSFAVYNPDGRDIVRGFYDDRFIQYIESHNNVLCWQLRDDMRFDQIPPAVHMDQLIRGHSDRFGMMKSMLNPLDWPYYGFPSLREFLKIAQPKGFWINQYPFFGTTQYYGDDSLGLQTRMFWGVTLPLDSFMTVVSQPADLWYTAQLHETKKVNLTDHDTTITFRRPTGPEMSMEAFIALSHGVRNIQYWPFDTERGGTYVTEGDTFQEIYSGLDSCFMDSTNWGVTEAWERLQHHLTPNLQALDEYLADTNMVWERSYSSHQIDGAGYVSSLHGWSDSFNPDTGWAQIREFHNDSTGAKYIMLVNRACSQDDQGTEAPDQHFTVKLNPANLGLDSCVYIIDLAHSVYYDKDTQQWKGIEDTTYSSVLNGTIPFTAMLKAGEGRLFKITKAPDYRPRGTINSHYAYSGLLRPSGDIRFRGQWQLFCLN